MTTVGIVSAGAMGSAVGAAYRAGGARVVTTLVGRSGRTAELAAAAGLELLDDHYKGRAALAAQALLTADAHGVTHLVLDDLDTLLPGARSLGVAATKAWRYVDEMREIAATQGAAGLPPELFDGVARAYEELAARARTAAPEQVAADLDWPALLEELRR